MADRSRAAPRPPFLGMPVQVDALAEDGQIVVVRDRYGPRLIVGTRPLTWTERALREAIHRNLAGVYRWLGWDLPTLHTGREVLAMLREAAALTAAPAWDGAHHG